MTLVDAARSQTEMTNQDGEVIIRVRDLVVGFGEKLVMNRLNLDVYRGEVLGFVGGSGQGKSVLTRAILGLVPIRAGSIEILAKIVTRLIPHIDERSSNAGASCFKMARYFLVLRSNKIFKCQCVKCGRSRKNLWMS